MNNRTPKWIYLVALGLGLPAIWLLTRTIGEDVPVMLGMIAALIGWAVISDVVANRRRGKQLALLLLSILISVFFLWWISISRPVAELSLAQGRHCKMQFHQWWTGKCVLTCDENGGRLGTATLATGLLTHPWAAFPGPDGSTVICFSRLDTTYAAFTVDVTKRNPKGATIPRKLEMTVDFSNFDVRACSADEVAFVANLIRASPPSLSNLSRWGFSSPQSRENALSFLKFATTRYDANDAVLKEAKPQILPGDD